MSSPLFACVIPGRPLTTSFHPVSDKKLVISIPQPASISEFTICLLQPTLPQGAGVAVYFSLPPYSDWQYCGSVLLSHPTAAFRAPWFNKIPPDCPDVQLGISLESLETLSVQTPIDAKEEELAMDSAEGIAKDLFNYMSSFSQSTGQYKQLGDVLVIPTDCIQRWFNKFKTKHKMEPFFWMKKDVTKKV
jgi:hypothetical protein